MRKDFKDSPKFRDKKKPFSGGPTAGPPGWLWLVVGLLVGLFVAFLVYLNTRVSDDMVDVTKPGVVSKSNSAAEKPKEPPKEELKPEEKKPKLEFFSELPKRKVEVKDDPPLAVVPAPTSVPIPTKTPAAKAGFVLQAGSFRHYEDADKRKANLAMLGVISRIRQVPAAVGSRYRVIIGPYTDKKEAESALAFLAKNNIEAIIQK